MMEFSIMFLFFFNPSLSKSFGPKTSQDAALRDEK